MIRPAFTLVLLTAAIRVALAADAVPLPAAGSGAQPAPAQAAQAAPEQAPALAWLTGVVTGADGQPLLMAQVAIAGTDAFAYTGEDGHFAVQVPSGRQTVQIQADGHEPLHLEGLELPANDILARDFQLAAAGSGAGDASAAGADDGLAAAPAGSGEDLEERELATIRVEEQRVDNQSSAAAVMDRRYSPQVLETISAEQISRAGDSDAGAALKRITGVTLVGGKHVFVRGLGERYSSVLLNGAQVPSPDPTRRVVPLDLFPTDVLAGIQVQKTWSADLPGEFAGGSVLMRSKGADADGFHMRLSATGKYLHGTTGKDGLVHAGGSRDWLADGVDARAFPDGISPLPLDPGERQQVGHAVAGRGYRTWQRSIDPGVGLGFGIGDSFQLGGWNLAYAASIRHAHDWASRQEQRAAYALGINGLQPRMEYTRQRTERSIDLSGLGTFSARYGNNHELGLTLLNIRQATDDTRIDHGWDTQPSDLEQLYQLEWVENALRVTQLHGRHGFPSLGWLEVDWLYSKADASRDEPNTRYYEYERLPQTGQYQYGRGSFSNDHIIGRLDDDNQELGLNLSLPVQFTDDLAAVFQAGAGRIERDRDSHIRRFRFRGFRPPEAGPDVWDVLTPEYIHPGGLVLQESTQATDAYTASQTLDSRYLAVELDWASRLRLNLGLREEDNRQEVVTYQQFAPNPTPVIARIDQVDRLPSAALTWMQGDNAQLRLGYSETLSRPDFRELSRAQYVDPELDVTIRGNPDLVQTDIRSYDLRWEYYFSDTESFSVALFKKDFRNPIERVNLAGTSVLLELRNAPEADSHGIELDYGASLGALRRWSWLDESWFGRLPLDDLYLGLNYTWIESEVELGEEGGIQTSDTRALQGQSPWVANLQLGYRSPGGRLETSLLYNVFGKRIAEVGVQGQPDVYEQPFRQLDLVASWALAERWQLKAQARNLLNHEVEFSQGGLPTLRYRQGREFSLGLEWTW